MGHSLLFIPDISGFTKFIQSTESEHSQHVIAELLEVLIAANTLDLSLAEVEGDALFFYKENEVPSAEMLLAQIENMFTAFYSHLKLLEEYRICPCNACATAPELNLKIIAHCGDLQFITVQNKRKPFGAEVIEVHRLLKNSIDSDNYVLISEALAEGIGLNSQYTSQLFAFNPGSDHYDSRDVNYNYSEINKSRLKLKPLQTAKKVNFTRKPDVYIKKQFQSEAHATLEYLSNFKYRRLWTKGLDSLDYHVNEVTRVGSEHRCVVNGSELDFISIRKDVEPGQLSYGEYTDSVPLIDELYQFFIISPLTDNACNIEIEVYYKVSSLFKKVFMFFLGKFALRKKVLESLDNLESFAKSYKINPPAQKLPVS